MNRDLLIILVGIVLTLLCFLVIFIVFWEPQERFVIPTLAVLPTLTTEPTLLPATDPPAARDTAMTATPPEGLQIVTITATVSVLASTPTTQSATATPVDLQNYSGFLLGAASTPSPLRIPLNPTPTP